MSQSRTSEVRDEAVRDRLVEVFRRNKGEATTADLVALTGLPLEKVKAELPAVSDEYGARLRVTESGEILWSFPHGLRSRYRGFGPSLKRFWKTFKKGAIEAGKFLFKAWIVLMLVGYFALFLLLALLAVVASFAAQSAGGRDRDDRGGGLGGIFITGRLLETIINIWFYSELFKDPRQRSWEANLRAQKRRERRPLHHAVFSFVFGESDPNANWDETERRAVVAWLQANKGVMTMPEFRALTGLAPLEAEERITTYLRDYGGEPTVSDNGTILFTFSDLLRRVDRSDGTKGGTIPMRKLRPFSANKGNANLWFGGINLVNLLFGGYFLAGSLSAHPLLDVIYQGRYATRLVTTGGWDAFWLFVHQLLSKVAGIHDPTLLMGLALGAVPTAFAAFFYAIPAIRRGVWKAESERIKVGNLRRVLYRAVLDKPRGFNPNHVEPQVDAAIPADPNAKDRLVVELAAADGGEPASDGSYTWEGIERAQKDVAAARSAVRADAADLGKAVFDSHDSDTGN
ncbi:MAG TPA: hypothetical protein VMV83_01760 [Rectinemataceae bacterium]|nr:hypothetical protein [Rectinemataceae bacterium]